MQRVLLLMAPCFTFWPVQGAWSKDQNSLFKIVIQKDEIVIGVTAEKFVVRGDRDKRGCIDKHQALPLSSS